jgi:predicted Zn finger-like uncharacterized protein
MASAVIKLDCPKCGRHYEVMEQDIPADKLPRCGRCKTRIPFDHSQLPIAMPKRRAKRGKWVIALAVIGFVLLSIPGVIMWASILKPKEPIVAGNMSQSEVCATASYLIRKNLTEKFKTSGVACYVKTDGVNVEIDSGYISPLNNVEIRYLAVGTVVSDRLKIDKIKLIGIDDDFRPFATFGQFFR